MTRTLRRGWQRLMGSLSGSRSESRLREEFQLHIDMLVEEHVRRGVPESEARRLAMLEFGAVESSKESYRDQRGLPVVDALKQDVRHALRRMRNNPAFTAVAILSLAVGIGTCTAMFSIVNSVLLRPLAFGETGRIFAVRELSSQIGGKSIPVNPVHLIEWTKQCPSIEQGALMAWSDATLGGPGEPERARGVLVTHNLFSILNVKPILGRTFVAEDELPGRGVVVILSETLWRRRYNADPRIVGSTIVERGQNREVVGILPADFRLPYSGTLSETAPNVHYEVFRPLVISDEQRTRWMGNFNQGALVKLKAGATAQQALAEINVVQAQFPKLANEDVDLRAVMIPIYELVVGRARLGLWMLLAAVGAVLLIVCLNLANLQLSRIAARSREAAIRAALGAGRWRQFQHGLVENAMVALCGGSAGVLLAYYLIRSLPLIPNLDIPRLAEIHIDAPVLLFSLAVTCATGLLFGMLPAWRLSQHQPQDALRSGGQRTTEGRRSRALGEGLVSLQVAISVVLLIVAGLLTASLSKILGGERGFRDENVLTASVTLAGDRYNDDVATESFLRRFDADLKTIPGVVSSGFITQLPVQGAAWIDGIGLEGQERLGGETNLANYRWASPSYFDAMRIPMRYGRGFAESDRNQLVAVVSPKTAKMLWPEVENPVGRRFVGLDKVQTIVGVAAEVPTSLTEEAPATVYYPYWQNPPDRASVVLRTSGDPNAAAGGLREVLQRLDRQLPLMNMATMTELVERTVADRSFQSMLVMIFAASALIVASLGIYGVVSYRVARRRTEIGVRLALGAEPRSLMALVIRQGLTPVLIGLGAGIALALMFSRALESMLFDVKPTDAKNMLMVSAILLAVGILACFLPARRAATTDPTVALRYD